MKYEITKIEPCYAVPCVICGESVKITDEEMKYNSIVKVCDKCKRAVMKMRGMK